MYSTLIHYQTEQNFWGKKEISMEILMEISWNIGNDEVSRRCLRVNLIRIRRIWTFWWMNPDHVSNQMRQATINCHSVEICGQDTGHIQNPMRQYLEFWSGPWKTV
jgi:hypothetical protein